MDQIYLVNLSTTARFPISVPYRDTLKLIEQNVIELADPEYDPRVTMPEESLPENYKKKMIERWEAIKPLTEDIEETVKNQYFDYRFSNRAKELNRSRQYIYDCFYSYLRHSFNIQGLGMPQGKEANRQPKKRVLTKKQGAVNKYVPQGKILNEYDFKCFEAADRLRSRISGTSIKKSFEVMLRKKYYQSRTISSNHNRIYKEDKYNVKLLPATERPSYNQYKYWLDKKYNWQIPKRDRKGKNQTEYIANLSGRKGNSNINVSGPGHVYQIDETPFDEEVVSFFDLTRSKPIGKATLYFVRDVFSRAIVGVYITTEAPSFSTFRQALFNAACDKTELLQLYHAPILPEAWNLGGIPQTVLVDRAELHNKLSEGMIEDLNITVQFTRAGRGDDKPDIETLFRSFSRWFQGLSKGHQTKSHRDIATQLARKNACLTIPELYQIAFVYIAHFNNRKLFHNYPFCVTMVRDRVPPIPAKLWEWGERYRPGYIQNTNKDTLYLKFLEKGEVSLRKDHIYLRGHNLRYNCEWLNKEGFQDRKESRNRSIVMHCRYHRGVVDFIFIWTPDGMKPAELDHKDRVFRGLSFSEVKFYEEDNRSANNSFLEQELNSLVNGYEVLIDTLTAARREKEKSTNPRQHIIKDGRKLEERFNLLQQQNQLFRAVMHEAGCEAVEPSDFKNVDINDLDHGSAQSNWPDPPTGNDSTRGDSHEDEDDFYS